MGLDAVMDFRMAVTLEGAPLTDEEVRYGLQESLLGKFTDAIAPTKRCLECGCDDEALHHLSCSSTAHLRTTRHTASTTASSGR